jgi:DNA-binding response OmpR family regulator
MLSNKRRVLLVDDDITILRTLKIILEKEGYAVETAETGTDALKKIKKRSSNVCLVDVKLPDIDGIDLLLKIDSATVKIIITGYSSEEIGIKASDYGADDYLIKPVKAEELINTVRSRLATKQLQ